MPKREVEYIESIYDRLATLGFDDLTEVEQHYFAVWWLDAEVQNGGLDQYFHNSAGDFAHAALRGLRAIGADAAADLFSQALAVFPGGVAPSDGDERWKLTQRLGDDASDAWHRLTDYEVWDSVSSLNEAYAAENDGAFLGPRTFLEQWHSKRSRGEDTQPSGMKERDMGREAEIDSQFTDRTCPECGQPAPRYRIFCKRCGFPHGVAPAV